MSSSNPQFDCLRPFSSCWCEQRPNHPKCKPTVPINNNILALVIVVAIILIVFFKFKHKNEKQQQK